MSTPSHLNAQPLVWGHGPRTFEVFLEPTCPYSVRALINSTICSMRSAADNVTIKIRLQSQPWHLFSGLSSAASSPRPPCRTAESRRIR
ncbi:Uncharacterised protein [Klebsiella pneumoniae]|nr:Uncharacterised protein [Klebsiella pneumoniae]